MKLLKTLAMLTAIVTTPVNAATFGLSHGWELSNDWLTAWNEDVFGIEDYQNGISFLGAEVGIYEQHGQHTHRVGVSVKGYDGTQTGALTFKYFGREMETTWFSVVFGDYHHKGNLMVTKMYGPSKMSWDKPTTNQGDVVGNGTIFSTVWTDLETQWTPNVTTVPLPAGLPLLLAGLGGFAFIRKSQV